MTVSDKPKAVWHVQEGAMVVGDGTPEAIRDKLRQMNVIAEIDWYAVTPHLVGINILVNKSGGVAALDSEDAHYRVGVTLEELARYLAKTFQADVTIGEYNVNGLDDATSLPSPDVSDDSDEVRVCEVAAIPEASVPFCAASEGKDMGFLDLEGGLKAVFYSTTESEVREGTMATMQSPSVALYVRPHDYSIAGVVTDDKGAFPEQLMLHSWLLKTELISGAVENPSPELYERIRADFGHGQVAKNIAEVFPGFDTQALLEATRTPGKDGVLKAIKALGLPSDMAAFLFGRTGIENVPHAKFYPAQGWTDAFAKSMDIKLTEPEPAGSMFWKLYRKSAVEKPWIVRGLAIGEVIVGAALTTAALREKKPRSGWMKLGIVVGIGMVVDAIFQVSLAQYLSGRAKRHREKNA